jgi:transposase-like protein
MVLGVGRPEFPRTILEFQDWFPAEETCRDYLFRSRWPGGFRCPRCAGATGTALPRRWLWQCSGCRYQVSVTAGSVLHRTRTPLHLWFWAAYLVTTATPGISAVQLQRQLGLSRYETAFMMLHKLRRAMVNPEREPLTGAVEVDECFVGGHAEGLRGGREHGVKALVIVAVEVRGAGSGRVRLQVIDTAGADTLCGFVTDTVAPGSTVHTDAWPGYKRLSRLGYDHRPRSQRAHRLLDGDPDEILPRVHRLISHLKTWLHGTHRGVSAEHLQVYLDEFAFRFNRRRTPMAAFQTLLGLGAQASPTTYQEITDSGPGHGLLAELTG